MFRCPGFGIGLKSKRPTADSQAGDALGHVIQINDYRQDAVLRGQCSCGATRAREKFLSKELGDLESESRRNRILRLEDLHYSLSETLGTCSPQWDYIYSSGLLATLPQAAAKQVVRKTASSLKPGGRLLFANLSLKSGGISCDTCASQQRVRRTEYDMADLTNAVPGRLISGQAIFRDPSGLNVYLELYRN